MNGYDFCKKILMHPKGGVQVLLDRAGDNECEWLELKASVQLLPEDEEKGDKPEDLYWSIANAIIGLMNTYGGAVIIGINDKNHELIPLEEHDPQHLIERQGIEAYLRCAVYDKIWSDNSVGKKNWGTKGNFHSESPLPKLVHIEPYPYRNGLVAVILVEPSIPCFRIWKGQIEEIRIRAHGGIGKTEEIIGMDNMTNYEKKERKIEATLPYLDSIYNKFLNQADKEGQKKKRNLWIVFIIIGLIALFFLFFTILPISCAPKTISPIPGKKTPDQFIVEHPLPTIEWYCLNHKTWWVTSDRVETCYGTWEMQRNKVFSNFRIVDPRNIMRCWGTQEMVVPIFNKLKLELEKDCATQDSYSK